MISIDTTKRPVCCSELGAYAESINATRAEVYFRVSDFATHLTNG
jgi:hypothetical protein